MSTTDPWQRDRDHVRLSIRLTPNGGRDAIDGVSRDADEHAHLKVRVSVVPENGKANKALIALLAKTLGTSKSRISIVSGDTARKKILRIDGDLEDLVEKLERLVANSQS